MKAVIFETQNAVFKFNQKEVTEQIILKKSTYDTDEADKLLNLISTGNQETIVIPEEPVFFDSIALDLIGLGKGSVRCKACNETYLAEHLIPIIVGSGGSPFDIQREKKGFFKRLFSKKRKPPEMFGGKGYSCPAGDELITKVTWRAFT